MKTIFLSVIISFLFSTSIFCQSEVIHLKNPSFEDYPRAERVPSGWVDCGFPGESPPDTHPSGAFNVTQAPANGQSYLGMAVRDNDTWEGVGQKLTSPLIGGVCYAFRINLCRSNLYVSLSRHNGKQVNYVEPVKLVLWGGNSFCEKLEKLAETPLIEHADWQPYLFTFQPEKEYRYIKLEAFYKQPILFPYNGNLLVDNASAIIPFSCDSVDVWGLTDYDLLFQDDTSSTVQIAPAKNIEQQQKVLNKIDEPLPPQPIPAIYFNSRLTEKERLTALEAIIDFVKENPLIKANVIIEEKSKKTAKKHMKSIKRALAKHQIHEYACRFTIIKK